MYLFELTEGYRQEEKTPERRKQDRKYYAILRRLAAEQEIRNADKILQEK